MAYGGDVSESSRIGSKWRRWGVSSPGKLAVTIVEWHEYSSAVAGYE